MENAIVVKNLTKRYDGFLLDHISFQIPQGTIVGFIGENGAGKSTTMKAMLGLMPIEEGETIILGHKVQNGESEYSYKEQIGVVFDECNFPGDLKVKYVQKIMRNIYRTWDEEKFMQYMKRFNVPVNKKVKELSKGMKMKLSIAVALSHDSRVLILDEATSGLDPVVRNEILDIFREFIEDEQHTVFISSHITSDIEKVADYVMLIHNGKLLLTESKDDLLYRYCIVKCSKAQAKLLPEELIAGKEENHYGVSVLITDKEQLENSLFVKEAEELEDSKVVIDRASIEDMLLYLVKIGGK